jgi:hypothetical protein
VEKKIKAFLQRLSGETPPELERRKFPSGKRTCGLQWRGIPVFPIRKFPPCGEHPLPSILSLLPSLTKTEGKAEWVFQVAVTPSMWPCPHVILSALKPKYLQCLQLVKASSSKRTHQMKGSVRDIRAQKAGGCWVSLGSVSSSGEDCKERV